MTEFVTEGPGYGIVEEEPTELSARNLITGGHLWASATTFFFIDFLFAYFYLRSLNNGGMWRPKHVDPSLALAHRWPPVIRLRAESSVGSSSTMP